MKFYPFGTFPTDPPAWFADLLAERGLDASAIPLWHLGTATDLSNPAALLLQMPPGYELFRHGHPCRRFEIVVQGSLEIGDGRVARPGDTFTAEPYTLYGPHRAGPEGCTTLEIFSAVDGMFRLLYEDEAGEMRESRALEGERAPGYRPIEGLGRD